MDETKTVNVDAVQNDEYSKSAVPISACKSFNQI